MPLLVTRRHGSHHLRPRIGVLKPYTSSTSVPPAEAEPTSQPPPPPPPPPPGPPPSTSTEPSTTSSTTTSTTSSTSTTVTTTSSPTPGPPSSLASTLIAVNAPASTVTDAPVTSPELVPPSISLGAQPTGAQASKGLVLDSHQDVSPQRSWAKDHVSVIVGVILGWLVAVGLLCGLFIWWRRRKQKGDRLISRPLNSSYDYFPDSHNGSITLSSPSSSFASPHPFEKELRAPSPPVLPTPQYAKSLDNSPTQYTDGSYPTTFSDSPSSGHSTDSLLSHVNPSTWMRIKQMKAAKPAIAKATKITNLRMTKGTLASFSAHDPASPVPDIPHPLPIASHYVTTSQSQRIRDQTERIDTGRLAPAVPSKGLMESPQSLEQITFPSPVKTANINPVVTAPSSSASSHSGPPVRPKLKRSDDSSSSSKTNHRGLGWEKRRVQQSPKPNTTTDASAHDSSGSISSDMRAEARAVVAEFTISPFGEFMDLPYSSDRQSMGGVTK